MKEASEMNLLKELIEADTKFLLKRISATEFERICDDIRLRHNASIGVKP